MVDFEGYRERQAGHPEVIKYDCIPNELKIQLFHLWNEFFRQPEIPDYIRYEVYKEIEKTACQRIPVEYFPATLYISNGLDRVYQYFKKTSDVEKCLDIIELVTFHIALTEPYLKQLIPFPNYSYSPKKAVDDTNDRFKKHGIGYQFVERTIIRVDNNLLNAETVIQTFAILTESKYKNVNDEYLMAHEHFRHRRNADCLTWCLKAYESTMKIIIKTNGWELPETPVATRLAKVLFDNQFFPNFLEIAMNNLRSFLENCINTIRNKRGGHGQGDEEIIVPDSLTRYMLYITGATIRLLVETQIERESQ